MGIFWYIVILLVVIPIGIVSCYLFVIATMALIRWRFNINPPSRIGYTIVESDVKLETLSQSTPVLLITQTAQPGAGEYNALQIFETKMLPTITTLAQNKHLCIAWGNVETRYRGSQVVPFFMKRGIEKSGCFLIHKGQILHARPLTMLSQYQTKTILAAIGSIIEEWENSRHQTDIT